MAPINRRPSASAAAARSPASRPLSNTYLRATRVDVGAMATTILVVDDEPLIRTFVARALRKLGHEVIEAPSAERALDLLTNERQHLGLLLTDFNMPGLSGAELSRRARLLRPSLPTLLMSGNPESALATARVLAPEVGLLQKPFSVVDLHSKLDSLLRQDSSAS